MLYSVYAKLVVDFESDKTPAQIKNALINTGPSLREALKAAWRAQLAKDPSGNTFAVGWHFHVNPGRQTSEALDLDDGNLPDEVEP